MTELISESLVTARKDHHCNASEWLNNGHTINGGELSFSEYRNYIKAKRNNFKIKKGDKYLRQTCKSDGEIYTVKMITEIHDICINHDLYRE